MKPKSLKPAPRHADCAVIRATDIALIIRSIRGWGVLLDSDLARIYGVQTRVLNQAVKRNLDRFPTDFMFELNEEEIRQLSQSLTPLSAQRPLRSQNVISKAGRGGRRYRSPGGEHPQ